MAYTTFSTANADYILQLGNHITRNRHNPFNGIDALVIEMMWKRPDDFPHEGHRQMNLPVRYCRNNNIPIFGTDVDNTNYGMIRSIATDCLTVPLDYTIVAACSFPNKRISRVLSLIYANAAFINQSAVRVARDAINARKIEEFVVPHIRQTQGKERPLIGLVFGAAHMGLEYDLKSKRRRNFTIWNWRNLNFGRFSGLDATQLNRVYEARPVDGEFEIYVHETGLFNEPKNNSYDHLNQI